jgi:hypothetical protein
LDNVWPLVILAVAGTGYFIASRTSVSQAAAKRAASMGQGLRRWLRDTGGLFGELAASETKRPDSRIGRNKIRTEEPKAGYGA